MIHHEGIDYPLSVLSPSWPSQTLSELCYLQTGVQSEWGPFRSPRSSLSGSGRMVSPPLGPLLWGSFLKDTESFSEERILSDQLLPCFPNQVAFVGALLMSASWWNQDGGTNTFEGLCLFLNRHTEISTPGAPARCRGGGCKAMGTRLGARARDLKHSASTGNKAPGAN